MYRAFPITLIALLAISSVHCDGGTNQQPASGTGKVYVVETVTKKPAGKAPEITWKDSNGKLISFSEATAGKIVLLNFWATWCGPCKRELPDLVAIAREMGVKGVVVVGIAVDQDERKLQIVKSFVEKAGIPYINIVDSDDKIITDAYGGIPAVPATFIIDRQGNIVQRLVGKREKAEFVGALQKVP
ncbi:MAG: TlpA disulfide reductase family protein [bacterium]|nr:TlpA disulfide reductase family protein [bacterium]